MSDRLIPDFDVHEMTLRSDMMRLYASRTQGDRYLPAPLVHTANELVQRGWIVPVGYGYALTEDGVRAWAEMVAPLTAAQRNPATNELRELVGMPLILRQRVLKVHLELLRRLIEEGSLPSGEYVDRQHRTLLNYRLIIVSDEAVTITAAGRGAYAAQMREQR